ncbi:SMI1/KNR4 family protein [Pseudocitrobacter sp. 73]|uniref:SMI1/KNR4 family protein n=1 Tax=Pseudocitrobacter sp. 73 TaxID=2605731 RepID=UPI0011F01F11|nr:SMI1/KNR4 family protein [Pseudocitrobacter sp. 73]KAA1047230.1 SMI1/KNR4 family protein [Pseudocitrobacter sp. 73]
MERIKKLISHLWDKHGVISQDEMPTIESELNHPLPDDVKSFWLWSNGGCGKFKNIYIALWPLEDIPSLNSLEDGYLIKHYLGNKFIAFGSDGGPICFLLDYRDPEYVKVCSVNFGDLDIEEVKEVAPSFKTFMEMALDGSLDDEFL